MKTALLALLLASTAGLLPVAGQALSFLKPHYIEIGGQCCSVLTGDFNGDGKLDIALANWTEGVTVLLGKGDGTFTRKDNPIPGFVISGLIAVADLNLDRTADIVATVNTARGDSYVVLLGRGDGSFQPPIDLGRDEVKAVADFNGDGKPDLLVYPFVASGCQCGFAVRLGNGDGTFQNSGPQMDFPYSHILFDVVGDFNNDGKMDVAQTSIRVSNKVYIWLGNGDGTFRRGPDAQLSSESFSTGPLAAGDFNGDGKTDLAVSFSDLVGGPPGIELLFGKGDGSFQTGAIYPYDNNHEQVQLMAADFNGDGIVDLAKGFTVLLGNGNGSLRPPVTFGQPTGQPFSLDVNASLVAAGDFNGDGKLDLVGVGVNGTDLSVLIGDTPGTDSSVSALSAATYAATIAPGSIATVFGKELAPATAMATGLPLPTVLQNTRVRILDEKGVERLGSLIYVSPSQIDFQVPPETAAGYHYAIVNIDNGKGPLVEGARATRVEPVAPGFFTVDGSGHGMPAATAVRVQADGSQTSIPLVTCSTPGKCAPVPIDLSGSGTVYLSLYGTGFRNDARGGFCHASPGQVSFGPAGTADFPIPVSYSGPQGTFPGLDQLNFALPKTLPKGMLDLECLFGGSVVTNHVTIYTK
jgi:uncharacterized protein (TIGR03437 family)